MSVTLIILSFLSLVFILVTDMLLVRYDKPIYMTNQSHVNLYVVPFLISFILFVLGLERSVIGILMLLIFTGVYIYISSYDKIILIGAAMDQVLEELESYLKASGRTYRIRRHHGRSVAIEINDYPNALTVRDADRWIEIDNHLNYDEEFIEELNVYFKDRVKTMNTDRRKPNVYFYILLAAIILIVSVLIVGNM